MVWVVLPRKVVRAVRALAGPPFIPGRELAKSKDLTVVLPRAKFQELYCKRTDVAVVSCY